MAIKLFREEFIRQYPDSIREIEREIWIQANLNHSNIIKVLGYGSNGEIVKRSGRKIDGLTYVILEHASNGTLFDLIHQHRQGMGEAAGRFFMHQLCDMIDYMTNVKGVVHRDFKPENILLDQKLNIKITDFGFANYKATNALQSYRGSMTYMAPEIKEGKVYDGAKSDLFSVGVILFMIV